MFEELIRESPDPRGIPCIMQRNPSLERASMQLFFINKIHYDDKIPTMALSILCVVGFNADYDGDELNIFLPMDNEMTFYLENLAPHKSSFSLSAPKTLSRNMSIPKPVISTMSSWLRYKDPVDEIKLQRMKELLL